MTKEERIEALKSIEKFCLITGDMKPEGYEWEYVLRASLSNNEIPKDIPTVFKSKIKNVCNNIYYANSMDGVELGVTRSGLCKEYENIEELANANNANIFDSIIAALYNKYREKAIKILEEKIKEIKKTKKL